MRGQTPFRAFGIRDVCRMHVHTPQAPMRINPTLPFAPVDLVFPHRRRALRLRRSL
jgi:hypothetical protein